MLQINKYNKYYILLQYLLKMTTFHYKSLLLLSQFKEATWMLPNVSGK